MPFLPEFQKFYFFHLNWHVSTFESLWHPYQNICYKCKPFDSRNNNVLVGTLSQKTNIHGIFTCSPDKTYQICTSNGPFLHISSNFVGCHLSINLLYQFLKHVQVVSYTKQLCTSLCFNFLVLAMHYGVPGHRHLTFPETSEHRTFFFQVALFNKKWVENLIRYVKTYEKHCNILWK